MGRVLADLLDELKAEHPAIGDVRSIGLLGCIELVKNRESKEPLAPYTGGGEVMPKLAAYLREHGVYTYVWRNLLHTNPPLCVTEEQLREVMAIVNDALTIADGASGNV